MLDRFKQIIETVDESGESSKPGSPGQEDEGNSDVFADSQEDNTHRGQDAPSSPSAVVIARAFSKEPENNSGTGQPRRGGARQEVTFDGELVINVEDDGDDEQPPQEDADQQQEQVPTAEDGSSQKNLNRQRFSSPTSREGSSGRGGFFSVDMTNGGSASLAPPPPAASAVTAASGDVPQKVVEDLVARLAQLEDHLVRSNLEKQQLECRLEEYQSNSKATITRDDNNYTNDDGKQSLVLLSRDFQSRIVELEYEKLTAVREQERLRDEVAQLQARVDSLQQTATTMLSPSSVTTPQHQVSSSNAVSGGEGQHHRQTESEEQLSKLYQQQLEARLVDAQRRNDRLQKTAADSLERAAARERLLQQDLDHTHKLLEENRRALKDLERPVEDQLEKQLKNTPVFSRIQQSAWGSFVANFAARLDRVGVASGRFLSSHAMFRLFVICYVILLHVYIFHLFSSVLHGMPATADDVHEHLAKIHGAGHHH